MHDDLVLEDANSGDTPHPFLVFCVAYGVLVIADDYETVNDPTARDFVIAKDDAIRLATELLLYARDGTPLPGVSASRHDIADALARDALARQQERS